MARLDIADLRETLGRVVFKVFAAIKVKSVNEAILAQMEYRVRKVMLDTLGETVFVV